MASMGDEARDFFDDEEDDDDSQFDSDDDYPHHQPPPSTTAPLTFPAATSLTFAAPAPAAPQFIPTPNPNPNPTFSPLPLNGAAQALHASYTALTAPELLYATPSPDRKRQRSSSATTEDPRRVFQKLWTDDDEINLLQGFLDFTTQRGTTHADYQYDTGPFFDQIRTRLQLDFHKNQLVEKLRRLKRKYRTAVNRINSGKDFKTAHDRATFEISQKIWNSDFKRERKRRAGASRPTVAAPQSSAEFYSNGAVENHPQLLRLEAAEATPVPAPPPVDVKTTAVAAPSHVAPTLAPRAATSVVEETVRSCLLPVFKELLQCVTGGTGGMFNAGLALNPPMQLSMVGSGSGAGKGLDERWKQQQILELEVFLRRTELVQEQIKSVLEELKSTGDGPSKSTLEEIKSTGVEQTKSVAMEELGSVGAEQSSAMEVTGSMASELAEHIKSAHEELGASGSEQRSL